MMTQPVIRCSGTIDDREPSRRDADLDSRNGSGLAFLSNPDKVGVAAKGGFGTDRDGVGWGALHTVTLRHNVAP